VHGGRGRGRFVRTLQTRCDGAPILSLVEWGISTGLVRNDPVIIGGTAGSGTSVLARMLKALGLDIGVGSTHASEWRAYSAYSRKWARKLTAHQLDARIPVDLVEARIQLGAIITTHSGRSTNDPWGWKYPRSYMLLPFLFDALPDMCFIHAIRDGRDMALSHRAIELNPVDTQFLPPRGPHSGPVAAARLWSITNRRVLAQGKNLLGDRYTVVRHEDLLDRPRETLERLAGFAKLSPSEAQVHAALSLLAPPGSRGRYLKTSRPDQLAIVYAARAGLRKFGYLPARSHLPDPAAASTGRRRHTSARTVVEGFGPLAESSAQGTGPAGLIVMGVARSGTSVSTQIAASIGLAPPQDDLMGADRYNASGYWESRSLSRLDDLLLAQWRCTWWLAPPAITPMMIHQIRGFSYLAAAAFVGTFTETPWVWKDPRLTMLLPFWEQVLGHQPVLFVHRDPGEVAASLARRDGFSMAEALAVWERHTRLALAALIGRPVVVSNYSRLCDDPDGWRSELAVFCGAMGLPVQIPADSAERLVRAPTSPTAAGVSLSAGQAALYAAVRALEGSHTTFPKVRLPPEDKSVGREITSLWRRTLRRSQKTYVSALA